MEKTLSTSATLSIDQLVDEGISRASLEIREVGVSQDFPLNDFSSRIAY
jgi:hypothetical protein